MALTRVLDTSAYSAYGRGEPAVRDAIIDSDRILMSPIVIGELRGGFLAGTRQARNLAQLAEFLAQRVVEVPAVTGATAQRYGLLYAALRRKGRPIPTNDMWIAAQALEHGAELVSYDAHFGEIENLAFIRPV